MRNKFISISVLLTISVFTILANPSMAALASSSPVDGIGISAGTKKSIAPRIVLMSQPTNTVNNGNTKNLTGTGQNSLSVANVKEFGASGSNRTTIGRISSGSKTLTLSSPIDFQNGMGVFIPHAGPMTSVSQPEAPLVNIGGGAKGHNTYGYCLVALDGHGGMSRASAVAVISDGPPNLGGLGPTGAQNIGPLGRARWLSISVQHPANREMDYAVYRTLVPQGSGLHTGFIGIYSYINAPFLDFGQSVKTPPPGIPTTPPSQPLGDSLVTKIVSGAGTTSLVLADPASSTVSNQTIYHDDTAAFEKALSMNTKKVYVPKGSYGISAPLDYDHSQGLLFGDGAASVIRYQGNTDAGLNLAASGITLKNLTFDGQKISNQLVTVQSHQGGLSNITIENTMGKGSRFYGIQVDNASGPAEPYSNIVIQGNQYVDCEYTYSTYGNINGLRLLNNQASFTDYNYAGRGISLHNRSTASGYTYTKHFLIRGNQIHAGNHSAGIVIQGSGLGTIVNNKLIISGGIFALWGIGAGRTVDASGGYTFSNNQCTALWDGSGVAVNLTNVVNVTVSKNSIANFGYAFEAGGYGGPAFPDSPKNHVVVSNNQTTGIAYKGILGKTPQSVTFSNNG